jgi:glutathione synthase/RimK-type ligase-like ATP-grasp enzyme
MTEASANRPTALIITTARWPHTAFVAARLRESGFSVAALCPRKGALRHTSGIAQFYTYRPLFRSRRLLQAIRRCSPSLVIPGDDFAAYALHELHARCRKNADAEANKIAELIERSLGQSDSFSIVQSKMKLIRFARECGIRIPDTRQIESDEELVRFAATAEVPFVLKQDETNGGRGVAIVRSPETAISAYESLKQRPTVDALKDMFLRFNISPLARLLLRRAPTVATQQYVSGNPANRAVACWQGKVLAGITVRALETNPPGIGSATVVEAIANAEIDDAVEKLIAKLGLSGFCGFDFIIDDLDRAYLLELNPRLTSACWIGTTPGTDLCAALFAAVTGAGPRRKKVTPVWPSFGLEGQRLALFPLEWMRSKTSEHLYSPYHRVPWHDPKLLSYLIQSTLRSEQRSKRNFVLLAFDQIMNRIERAEAQPLQQEASGERPSS